MTHTTDMYDDLDDYDASGSDSYEESDDEWTTDDDDYGQVQMKLKLG